jgi:hypothetical protein
MLLIRPNSGGQGDVGLGCVLTALGTSATPLVDGRFLLLGCRFGLASRLLRVTAHHLLDLQRKRAPFLGTDHRSREEGQPWYWFAVQTGNEPIQTMGVLTGFGDHDCIASQQGDLPGRYRC